MARLCRQRTPAMCAHEISGNNVLDQSFNYRRRDRVEPQIRDKRPPSPLEEIRPSRGRTRGSGLLRRSRRSPRRTVASTCSGPRRRAHPLGHAARDLLAESLPANDKLAPGGGSGAVAIRARNGISAPSELGAEAAPFMLHLLAALAEMESGRRFSAAAQRRRWRRRRTKARRWETRTSPKFAPRGPR